MRRLLNLIGSKECSQWLPELLALLLFKGSFKGVPIESVGKMLGHRSLKTTQIYAKVLDEKVERDMDALEKQLQKQPLSKK
ncbi:hypothetical protein RM549_09275 [Salegentibacter sp. F188]|uniref:Tyr recombinase domain-containing protein n=1 Tax=Autumnicola patrickiae TaxID=3075591 RepID=A0ABU3E1Y4_9FLAO|nr:hypothetical protein [Salegentibacter sp. F188]MDT0689973.1 hypothetical protein [Salegentibacter sp. F188]